MNEIEAHLALSHVPGLGPVKIKHVINYFGSALCALVADFDELMSLKISNSLCEKIVNAKNEKAWREDLAECNKQNITLLSYKDPRFPKSLLEVPDCPSLLYIKGNLQDQLDRCIAIVGTRAASIYGREMAEKIGCDLAKCVSVVSGLASGIDTHAHIGALQTGATVAVLGSGLSHIYPPENISLSRKICDKGLLISEYPMKTAPNKFQFPRRNRIISGISEGVCLIEAPLKSGAMLTMEMAYAQKRKLFALSGRADSESFRGNHHLIKEKQAFLIENAKDILVSIEYNEGFILKSSNNSNSLDFLDNDERDLYHKMPKQECSIDELILITKLPVVKLNVLLMSLMLKSVIKEFPGKIYKIREPV